MNYKRTMNCDMVRHGMGYQVCPHCEEAAMSNELQDAIAPATRLLESVGTIQKPNEDYPIYRLYPIVFRDAVTVSYQAISYAKRIAELTREIEKSPCAEWGHLMIHNHISPSGETVCDLCARVGTGYRMWMLERVEDNSLIFCDGSPAPDKEKVLKLAGQRARDNGFNYRVIPIELHRSGELVRGLGAQLEAAQADLVKLRKRLLELGEPIQ